MGTRQTQNSKTDTETTNKITDEFCNKCILCLGNCIDEVEVVGPETDLGRTSVELTFSLCKLIQLPTDPFLDYFLQDDIFFCPKCTTGVLQEIYRHLKNLKEIQQQLDKLKNSVRTGFLIVNSAGSPKKRGRGRPRGSFKRKQHGHGDKIRGQIAQALNNDKSSRIDLNDLANLADIKLEDNADKNDGMMADADMDDAQDSIVDYDITTHIAEEYEDVKIFSLETSDNNDIEINCNTIEQEVQIVRKQPRRANRSRSRSISKNRDRDPSDDMECQSDNDSDWSPEIDNTKTKLKVQKRLKGTRMRNRNDPLEHLICTWENCNQKFKLGEEIRLTAHVRRIHEGIAARPFQCPQCLRDFRNMCELEHHMLLHSDSIELPYVCTVCGKRYRSKLSFQGHCRLHRSRRTFTCEKCSQTFSSRSGLHSHMEIKHGGRLFICEICSHSFKNNSSLKAHQRFHHHTELGLEPYKCEACQKVFVNALYLRDHQKLHTGEGLFECPNCDYKATSKTVLRQHERIHSSEKIFKCNFNEECGAAFRQSSGLRAHLDSHTGEKPFSCRSCTKTFRTKLQCTNHDNAIHSGLTPFICLHCGAKFPIKKYLDRHAKKHLVGNGNGKVRQANKNTSAHPEKVVPPEIQTAQYPNFGNLEYPDH